MNREQVLQEIRQRVKNPNLVKHMLATEVVMRSLARHFGEDEEAWALAGLIHDIDVELTGADLSQHSKMGAGMVRALGLPEVVAHAVLCHNEIHGEPRKSLLDKALFCADPVTGLIVAATLVLPEKKLSALSLASLSKRFKEKRFAAGARREQIALCAELGQELEAFLNLALEAMKQIPEELGL
ncbi:MAG: HD domain-containing protein [Chloroflexota bacterium]